MAVKKKKKTQSRKKTTVARRKPARRPTRKKRVGKIQSAKKNVLQKLDQINRVINRFEGEVEGLVKKLVKQGERSRKDLRKNFDDILSRLKAGGLFARANETREELEKEVRRLAEEVIGTFKDVETIINSNKVNAVFKDARKNFLSLMELLSDNGLIHQARLTVLNTRRELFGLLSIPTQGDVEKLEKKIVSLEKRLNNISRKAA